MSRAARCPAALVLALVLAYLTWVWWVREELPPAGDVVPAAPEAEALVGGDPA